jgi:hypothetical protein
MPFDGFSRRAPIGAEHNIRAVVLASIVAAAAAIAAGVGSFLANAKLTERARNDDERSAQAQRQFRATEALMQDMFDCIRSAPLYTIALKRGRSCLPDLMNGLGYADGTQKTLRASLGVPVDRHALVSLDALADAIPHGAIWYSQACCSAGSDATSNNAGLIPEGPLLTTLQDIAALGAFRRARRAAAVRPRKSRPGRDGPRGTDIRLNAERGRDRPSTRRPHRVRGIEELFNGQPLGYAFDEYPAGVGDRHTQWAARQADRRRPDSPRPAHPTPGQCDRQAKPGSARRSDSHAALARTGALTAGQRLTDYRATEAIRR